MVRMLIVDDERFEREGVKFLVGKYNLELEVAEADSGEKALTYMEQQAVDILFSDIRMKGMDGLELAEKVREKKLPVKIIFMSAYGEFEYAQRAIDLEAVHYILKPVKVSSFLKVISKVMQMIEDEKKEQEQQKQMESFYWKGLRYEKQRVLSGILHGEEANAGPENPAPLIRFSGEQPLRMIILDTRRRFFDNAGIDFERDLASWMQRSHDVVNLNEYQSLLFVETTMDESAETLVSFGKRLVGWVKETYGADMHVAVSRVIDELNQIGRAYNEMEAMLENKFYYDRGTVVCMDLNPLIEQDTAQYVEEELAEMKNLASRNEGFSVKLRFEQLFDEMQENAPVSSIYLKYACAEIVKSVFDSAVKKQVTDFKIALEQIYKAERLSDLRRVTAAAIEKLAPEPDSASASMRKVIEDVVRIIEEQYGRDLSVDLLAEQVYLSPNYLSHLFKKQKGVSIIKFITKYRMEKAKELLVTTNKRVADIGAETGYANVTYFCSLFKSHFGKTPTGFREELSR